MKLRDVISTIAITLFLAACGGSDGEDRRSLPFLDTAVVSQPETPIAGECVDSYPAGDGFGWNGVSTCRIEPADDGSEQTGSHNNTVVVTDNQGQTTVIVNQQNSVHEKFVGSWNCAATGDYRVRWILELRDDLVLVDTSRGVDDPERLGTWEALSDSRFAITFPSHENVYLVSSDVAQSEGSHCQQGTFPITEEAPVVINAANGEARVLEPAVFTLDEIRRVNCHIATVSEGDDFWTIASMGSSWSHAEDGIATTSTRFGETAQPYSLIHGIYTGPADITGRWVDRRDDKLWFYTRDEDGSQAIACFI